MNSTEILHLLQEIRDRCDIIEASIPHQPEPPSFGKIVDAACKAFGADRAQVMAPRGNDIACDARCAAMLVCRELISGASYPTLAKYFRRHHGAVMSAVKKAKDLEETDKAFGERLLTVRLEVAPDRYTVLRNGSTGEMLGLMKLE